MDSSVQFSRQRHKIAWVKVGPLKILLFILDLFSPHWTSPQQRTNVSWLLLSPKKLKKCPIKKDVSNSSSIGDMFLSQPCPWTWENDKTNSTTARSTLLVPSWMFDWLHVFWWGKRNVPNTGRNELLYTKRTNARQLPSNMEYSKAKPKRRLE